MNKTKKISELKEELELSGLSVLGVNAKGESVKAPMGNAIVELDNRKANKSGRYSQMTAGFADNLVGRGEATAEEFSFRPSAGDVSVEDGTARIVSLKGNSAVWNQLINNSNFSNGTTNWTSYNSQLSAISGGIRQTNTSSSSQFINQKCSLTKGHEILIVADFKRNTIENVHTLFYLHRASDNGYDSYRTNTFSSTERIVVSGIITTTDDIYEVLVYPAINSSVGASTDIYSIRVFDLTLMFGADNEPSTIEEFNARKPYVVDEFAYNSGEIISMNADSIKSVGFNAWDEVVENNTSFFNGVKTASSGFWSSKNIRILSNTQYEFVSPYTLYANKFDSNGRFIGADTIHVGSTRVYNDGTAYIWIRPYSESTFNHDICIHLVQSGYKNGTYEPHENDYIDLSWVRDIKDNEGNLLFPNGLRSAGSAYDEIRYNRTTEKWEAVKRIGEVDLGLQTWYDMGSGIPGQPVWRSTLMESKAAALNSKLSNILTNSIAIDSADNVYMREVIPSIALVRNSSGNYVSVASELYNEADKDAFIESMRGMILYYELAEPIVVELDENFSLDYLIWDFGTEEIVSSASTTKFKGDVIYQFNAVDRIRDCSRITIKDNGNLVLMGKEFMPATPSGDPMHYEYISAYPKLDYNPSTSKWSYYANEGGLTDLTTEEVRYIFARSGGGLNNNNFESRFFNETNMRTNFITFTIAAGWGYVSNNALYMFCNCHNLEVAVVSSNNSTFEFKNMNGMFFKCYKLRRVVGDISMTYAGNNVFEMFRQCESLEDVKISGLKQNISFEHSPNLSYESLRYMIENCAANSSISILVHNDVYDKIFETEEWYSLSDLCAEMTDSKGTDIEIRRKED